MTWADVLILPDDPAYDGKALWITVDAVLDRSWQPERLASLGKEDFYMDSQMDLAVRADDFNKTECLEWIARWMRENLAFTELCGTGIETFAGRSGFADMIIAVSEKAEKAD